MYTVLVSVGGMAAAVVAAAVVALHLHQRWSMHRHLEPLGKVDHPRLGRFVIYRNRWQLRVSGGGPLDSCTISGRGAAGGPTPEELSLVEGVLSQARVVLSAADAALLGIQGLSEPRVVSMRLQPALLRIEGTDTFTLFLASRPSIAREMSGFYVRFKGLSAGAAGPTPLRERRR